jgi:nitrogenase molybdenum-cofactor synthesis protein NifE
MLGLNKKLPPFSSDITGACSALFNLGGIVVVHEPSCCTSCYTTYDEPRYYGSSSPLYSSELREIHLSTGDDETILRRVEAAVKLVECRFIAIIGSPIPMFTGTDYNALASEIENRTGLPAFAVDTEGFKWYDEGASKALIQLAKIFIRPYSGDNKSHTVKKGKERLNIIGALAIEGIKTYGPDGLVEYLQDKGFEILSVLSDGSSIDEIAKAAEADRNMVVSVSGIRTAKYLESCFGISYSCGIPIGRGFGKTPVSKNNIRNVLITGDQIISNSIRDCLISDFGITNVTVSSFFTMSSKLMQPGDCKLNGEDDLEHLLEKNRFDVFIGDPAFIRFTERYPQIQHILIPHIPVSGYNPLISKPSLIGENGFRFFKDTLIDT